MKHLIQLLVMTLCLPVIAADDSAFAALLEQLVREWIEQHTP
ncbi:MAG: hypothetical protein OXC05_10570 [Halieaceae bacterium]|nr:hypothetical protein [Halieaceae bacterium]